MTLYYYPQHCSRSMLLLSWSFIEINIVEENNEKGQSSGRRGFKKDVLKIDYDTGLMLFDGRSWGHANYSNVWMSAASLENSMVADWTWLLRSASAARLLVVIRNRFVLAWTGCNILVWKRCLCCNEGKRGWGCGGLLVTCRFFAQLSYCTKKINTSEANDNTILTISIPTSSNDITKSMGCVYATWPFSSAIGDLFGDRKENKGEKVSRQPVGFPFFAVIQRHGRSVIIPLNIWSFCPSV